MEHIVQTPQYNHLSLNQQTFRRRRQIVEQKKVDLEMNNVNEKLDKITKWSRFK